MSETVKHTPGRWVYTSAMAKFEGQTTRVRAYHGSIHAGWEDSPEFESAEDFYAWAKEECERRNVLECAAPEMLEALPDLSHVITWLENGCDPLKARDELAIYQQRINAARAKAGGSHDKE